MNYISEDFHIHYLPSYKLYVNSDLLEDQIVVVDDNNEVLVYSSYNNETPSLQATKILSLPFEKVYISLPHENLIFIPTEVFENSDINLFKDFFINDIQDVKSVELKDQNITALYELDPSTNYLWSTIFSKTKIVPSFVTLLNNAFLHLDNSLDLLGVHFSGNQADIYLFINGEFRLYNTYEVQTPDDLSYYVLNIIKNYSIEGKFQKIILSGVDIHSEWGTTLSYYSKELVKLESDNRWKTSNIEVQEKIKGLSTLNELELCEL